MVCWACYERCGRVAVGNMSYCGWIDCSEAEMWEVRLPSSRCRMGNKEGKRNVPMPSVLKEERNE